MGALSALLAPVLGPIISAVVGPIIEKQIAELKKYISDQLRVSREISEIGKEANSLFLELDNANSEVERKAILRKITQFSDLARLRIK